MKSHLKLVITIGALALAVSSATALAYGQPTNVPPQGKGNGPIYTPGNPGPGGPTDPTPGPRAGLPAKAKAYGRYCQGQSKRHVKGEKGTEFSRCVTAMARAANNSDLAPGRACKGLSRRHVKGEKGTEFSRCVKAAAKLRRHQPDESEASS
jgi:hypothetical protein